MYQNTVTLDRTPFQFDQVPPTLQAWITNNSHIIYPTNMRVFAFSVITIFTYFLLALRLTNPATASALLPRKQVCANAPNIVAGK